MRRIKKCIIFLVCIMLLLSMNLIAMADTVEEGLAEQFEYNETSARNVKVNVTISYDGVPIISSDEKDVLAYKEVTIPYFDLANYGLSNFYRYPTDENKDYITEKEVVRRPTVLHLYIYLIEKYYLDVETRYIGTGEAKDLLFGREDSGVTAVKNLLGNTAYSVAGRAPMALNENQGACHMYMTNFWGYSANLNYYVNHWWPLWKDGGSFGGIQLYKTGATADYILLENGDFVELAMFSSEGFTASAGKGFAYFPQMEYEIREGDALNIEYIKRAREGKECLTDHVRDDVTSYECFGTDKSGSVVIDAVMDSDSKTVTFTGFDEPGTYYIYGLQKGYGTDEASCDPAVAKVIVKEAVSAEIKNVLDKINAIGKVDYSDECRTRIEAARTAYDALSDEEKETIFEAELAVLIDAEKIYGELKAEADKKAEEEQKQPEKEENKQPEEDENKKPEQQQPNKEPVVNEPPKDEKPGNDSAEEALKEAQIKAVKETGISALKAKKYKTTGIKLTWKKNSSLDGYEVLRSTKKNAGYKPVKTVTQATYTLKKGLNKNKAYYYKVRGYKVIDGSKVYTKEAVICANLNQTKAIKAIAFTGAKAKVTKGKVTLTWDKHDSMYSLKGYKIYKSTKKNSGFKQVKTVKKEKVTITSGLKKGKTYYFKIQGYAKVGKRTVTTKAKVIKVKSK